MGLKDSGTCLCGIIEAVIGTSASVAPPTPYPLHQESKTSDNKVVPHKLSHATRCKESQVPEIETIGGDWKVHA